MTAKLYRTPQHCIAVVCELLDITPAEQIAGKGQRVKLARALALHAAREHTLASFPEIGRAFGVDHTTAMRQHRSITSKAATDPELAQVVADIAERIHRGPGQRVDSAPRREAGAA